MRWAIPVVSRALLALPYANAQIDVCGFVGRLTGQRSEAIAQHRLLKNIGTDLPRFRPQLRATTQYKIKGYQV